MKIENVADRLLKKTTSKLLIVYYPIFLNIK